MADPDYGPPRGGSTASGPKSKEISAASTILFLSGPSSLELAALSDDGALGFNVRASRTVILQTNRVDAPVPHERCRCTSRGNLRGAIGLLIAAGVDSWVACHADDTAAESDKFCRSRRPAAGTDTRRRTTSALVKVSRCQDHSLMQHHGHQVFL
jgi:hypothetical protein